MSSTVFYRMFHGTTMEPIHFTGHHISLIDLKRAILDLKNISRGLDFDFKVMDAEDTSKVYTGDETLIPKNSSVIVVRTPASGQGLLARLKGRQTKPTAAKEESIVIPAKAEATPPQPVATAPTAVKASAEVSESAELAALEAINEKAAQAARPSWGLPPPVSATVNPRRTTTGAPPPNYECHRCGRPGHYIQNCPTNSDPNFDKPKPETEGTGKLHGVPSVTVQRVSDISTVNTTGKLIKNTKDGAFEIVESSQDGYNRLVKHGGATASASAIDMTQVPDMLKCALSGKLLRDPVTLPCCGKVVSDGSIREALFRMDEYQCPLCRTQGITPDELRPNHDKKRQVEDFLANKTIPSAAAPTIASPPSNPAPAPAALPPPRYEAPFVPPFMPMPFMMPPHMPPQMPIKPIWELFPLTRDEFRMVQKHQRSVRGEPERPEKRGYVPRRRSPSREKAWYERRARPRDRNSRDRSRQRSRSTDKRRSISRDRRSERDRDDKKERDRDDKRSRERSERRRSRDRSTDRNEKNKEKSDRDRKDSKDDRKHDKYEKYEKYDKDKSEKREKSRKSDSHSEHYPSKESRESAKHETKDKEKKSSNDDKDRRDRKRSYDKEKESKDSDRKRSREDKGRKVTEDKRERSPRRERR